MIKYCKGDLFQLTETVAKGEPLLLAHACNCLGYWGNGIALTFKNKYPGSYKLYYSYCKHFQTPYDILGTSLIIPVIGKKTEGNFENALIVCLFTSVMGQESQKEIAKNTKLAMLDLKRKLQNPNLIQFPEAKEVIAKFNTSITKDEVLDKYVVNMPKINNGLFGVPWEFTEKALQDAGLTCSVFEL